MRARGLAAPPRLVTGRAPPKNYDDDTADEVMMKKCYACGNTKPLSEYYRDKSRPDGVSSRCKECDKKKRKAFYEKNGRAERRKNSEWKKKNAERHSEINNRWSRNNRWYANDLHRKRSQSDYMYRLKRALRRSVNRAFFYTTESKRKKTEAVLGCSWEQARQHMESKFKPGMSWDNYGEWHIDHIIPLATAKTAEDAERLSRISNLQPLWAKDNMRKGAKIDYRPD